ncbi:hypothetical protein ACFL6I_08500, partial [candidate division KSB1 bacterium]
KPIANPKIIRSKTKSSAIRLYTFFKDYDLTTSRKIYFPIIEILNLYYRGITHLPPLYSEDQKGREAIKRLIFRNRSSQ